MGKLFLQRRTFLIGLVSLGLAHAALAQQDPMYTKYMFNSLAFNPAYAGTKDYLSATALVRDQWLSWNKSGDSYGGGAPITYTASVHSPFRQNTGLGAFISQDRIGSTSFTGIELSYAYRLRLNESMLLSLGLQGGLTHRSYNYEGLRFRHGGDGAFDNSGGSGVMPNAGAGAYLYSERFYVGASVPRLFESRMREMTRGDSPSANDIYIARNYRHMYLASGAAFPLGSDNLVFKPSVLIKGVGWFGKLGSSSNNGNVVSTPTEVDLDVSLLFNKTLWIGASLRTTTDYVFQGNSSHDSADIWTAFYLDNGLRIGAAYDYSLTRLQTFGNGSVELMLGYDLNFSVKKIVTPRYF